jgi:hypothetical protein
VREGLVVEGAALPRKSYFSISPPFNPPVSEYIVKGRGEGRKVKIYNSFIRG